MNSRQLKMGVVLSYLATGLNMMIQLVYTPVMIRLLGQTEYGLYTLVGSFVSYLSLFSLGFTGAYLRFYSRYDTEGDREGVARLNGMFLTVFSLMAMAAMICGMTLSQYTDRIFGNELTADEMHKAGILMRILVVNIALTFPSSLFDSIVSAHEQFIFQRTLTLAGIVLNPFLCLPMLLAGGSSVAVVSVTTCITSLKLAVNMLFCIHKLKVPFTFRGLDFSLLKEIGAFSFFLFLNMIVDQVNWSVDKYILGWITGTVGVAVYGVASQINTLYLNFSVTISSVFSPRINRIAAKQDAAMTQEFTDIFIKVGRIQFVVLGLIASGFVIFGKYFLTDIYLTSEYADAYEVALFLILPVTIPLIQNVGIEIQRSVNRHQFRSVVYVTMAAFNTAISIPLAMRYGSKGAAAGTAISLLLANGLIMNVYYQKKLGINIVAFWKSILGMFRGMAVPAVAGAFIIRYVSFCGVVDFMMWVMGYILIYVVSVWILSMNEIEKQLFRNYMGGCR